MLPRIVHVEVGATCIEMPVEMPVCGGTIHQLISAAMTTVICTAHTTNLIYNQHI
jgi:hypothetical protein